MITFRDPVDGATGTIADGAITCTNRSLQSLLQSVAVHAPVYGGLPDPDAQLFDYLVKNVPFKLKLVSADAELAREPGRIY